MRALRISTLVVPPLLAAFVVVATKQSQHVYFGALAFAWVVMIGALMMRFVEARDPCRPRENRPGAWEHLDALTGTGRAMMWIGSGAIAGAALTGWASLSVVGVLGLGTVFVATTWTALASGGDGWWRGATVTRSIIPAIATEGEPLHEEVRFSGVRVPVGTRLFAYGRAMRHGAVSRYVVGSEASRADVKLESGLGAAVRGEHHAGAIAMWLGDVLGIAYTPVVRRGGKTTFTVLPRPGAVEGVRQLLGRGGDDMQTRPTQRLPTEGTFRIREYAPGDDTRRIDWVRSLRRDELIVRLPDEVPLADPAVRLVLDNELGLLEPLTCRAPDEMLDVVVRIWLGIAKQLSEAGTRVSLVTAADGKLVEKPYARRSSAPLKLAARVAWQETTPLPALLRPGARHVIVTTRPRVLDRDDVAWVIVPERAWASPEPWPPSPSAVKLPFPTGSADNRYLRRAAERKRVVLMWQHRSVFSQQLASIDWRAFAGHHFARPKDGRVALEVIR
jgi:uncharacterized protein (DUF58 family)